MWRDFFSLARREQLSFLCMFIALSALIVFLFLKPGYNEPEPDPALQVWIEGVGFASMEKPKEKLYDHFTFDPNTVKVKDMERLGLSKSIIINLLKYREAGGYMKSVSKFGEIYGVDSVLFNRLKPFVAIGNRVDEPHNLNRGSQTGRSFFVDLNNMDSTRLVSRGIRADIVQDILQKQKEFYFKDRVSNRDLSGDYSTWLKLCDTLLIRKNTERASKKSYQIELNSADTAVLALLYGIGPVLSRRIVSYRKRIGGFYLVRQLQEVSGVSPLVIEDNKNRLCIDTALIVPLNIARANLRQMKEHPYLNFYMAKAIYESRKRGELHSIKQFFSESAFANVDKTLLGKYFIISN